ncbi:Arabinogalactan peptide 16 [Platanthera guangdongensis]|uniref:Arabinogalactan peptide 16 n=1 Tax=Platanthera guangdongensis TaxID=2320717 RepID=A0ABR2M179_9ASPA
MNSFKAWALFFLAFFFSGLMQLADGQATAPAPDAAPPMSNDGKAVDQGVAYVLMLVALLLTYLIH